MAQDTFNLVVANPELVILDEEVESLTLRSAFGDAAFLAHHAPFVGEVDICLATVVRPQGESFQIVIDGGLVRAGGNRVVVLANDAQLASDVEQESLRRRRQRYEERLEELDDALAESELRSLELRGSLID
ncbi:MAG: FoF1 ATP synthase subunit delta/epsilon [Ferrimicrobium sp.]|uniref:ATP synthase epsilon chain n=1 Tax=Ferrimicrobium acidiphilum TaxID=121039 RepID=A0ABV3XZ07_9ACTN|nr:F0F1 ATP synthase subunit epsilon [Ferrimicrobium sp.]MCL5973208.1 F0F1 ATP synthase subunit epsilon [Actinomycetota bacterium]